MGRAALTTASQPPSGRRADTPAEVSHTRVVEPESHRLDRERMLAERRAIAERVGREVDEVVAAAAEKRRRHLEVFVDRMRVRRLLRIEEERLLAILWAPVTTLTASADQNPTAARAHEARRKRDELARLLRDLSPEPQHQQRPEDWEGTQPQYARAI
jgi:hypothetical protein